MKALIVYIFYTVHFALLIYVGTLERGSFTSGVAVTITAFFLIGLGLIIYIPSYFKLGVTKSSHMDFSGLITTGTYKFVRNPQILAWFLVLTGVSLYLASLYSLVLTFALWLFFKLVLQPIEQRKLIKEYGREYVEYKERTPSGI